MTPYILVVTKCRDDVFGGLFFSGQDPTNPLNSYDQE